MVHGLSGAQIDAASYIYAAITYSLVLWFVFGLFRDACMMRDFGL